MAQRRNESEKAQVSARRSGHGPDATFPVIAIGASAGGIEALECFLGGLPRAETGMAFVVILHLDPRRESLLPEILERATSLRVVRAAEGLAIEPDHLYVNTPDSALTIDSGVFHSVSGGDGRERSPHCIDDLFVSLAADRSENAIGIVLSGAGSDGALGLKAIKAHGGHTLAQTPDSARFDGMPSAAISTGVVDLVLPPEQMPARLAPYARKMAAAEAELARPSEGRDLSEICALLRVKVGHDFNSYKRSTLLRRIHRRMHVVGVDSLHAYLDRLRQDAGESTLLFRDLLIGVTQFFRDGQSFEALASDVIPRLHARGSAGEPLRVWVPACSSGEEAYSIAILLHEQVMRSGVHREVTVFATDIDEAAVQCARLGRYPEGIVRHVTPERIERYFRRDKDCYRVIRELRDLCVFSLHNVVMDPPFSRIDLLCCRNLLIYLDKDLQDRLIGVYHYALKPGGYLFLGASENVGTRTDLFKAIDKSQRIFQRCAIVGRANVALPISESARSPSPRATGGTAGKSPSLRATFERVLLENYAPACVIIDERQEIVYFCGHTGKYLEPAAGLPSTNVIDMARRGLRVELRSAILEALETRAAVVHERVLVKTDGVTQPVRLSVRPVAEAGENANLWMIVFQDLELRAADSRPSAAARKGGAQEIVQRLENELTSVKKQLRTATEDLETSNDDLRSSNEELLSVNEELQASNEELQTSREELQSVNEELETVNQDLQHEVGELDEANSDLRNLFLSTPVATVFLDKELRVKLFTPAATAIFRLIGIDVGRPLADITSCLDHAALERDIREVLRSGQTVEREVEVAERDATFFMRIAPYRTSDDAAEGAVVTFVDTSELRRTQTLHRQLSSEVELGLGRHQLALQAARLAVWESDPSGQRVDWSPEFEELCGLAPGALGRRFDAFLERVHPEDRARVEQGFLGDPARTHMREIEHRVVRADGSVRWLLGFGRVVQLSDGRPRVLCGVSLDITDRKRAEEALRTANEGLRRTNDDLKQLSYAIAHDLQEQLRTVSTYAELLLRRAGDQLDATARGHASRVVEGSTRMGTLFQALQEYWQVDRIEEHPEPVACDETLKAALAYLADAIAANDARISADPLPRVRAHAAPVVQLFQNLLGNALKYRGKEPPRIHVSAEEQSGMATISIKDNGIGIEPQHHKRIFAIFKRLHGNRYPGRGIGLATCSKIVARYGGRIWVESALGTGSTFRFTLPLDRIEHAS